MPAMRSLLPWSSQNQRVAVSNPETSPTVSPKDSPIMIRAMAEPVTTTLFSLKGKVIVVSGGGRGLGLSQAEALIDHGAAGELKSQHEL